MHGPARDTDLGTGRFVEPDHPLDMVRAIPVVGIQEGDGIVAEAECRQAARILGVFPMSAWAFGRAM